MRNVIIKASGGRVEGIKKNELVKDFKFIRTRRVYFQDSKAIVWMKWNRQMSGQTTGKEP